MYLYCLVCIFPQDLVSATVLSALVTSAYRTPIIQISTLENSSATQWTNTASLTSDTWSTTNPWVMVYWGDNYYMSVINIFADSPFTFKSLIYFYIKLEIEIAIIIAVLVNQFFLLVLKPWGPGAWLRRPAWKVGDRGFKSYSGLQISKKQNIIWKHFLQYCGEPPWPRCSVLGLEPPWLEFRIMCLEGSVISFISPSSGGSLDPA